MRESVSQFGGCCVTERAPTRSFPRIHIHHHMPDDYDEDDDDDDYGDDGEEASYFHPWSVMSFCRECFCISTVS